MSATDTRAYRFPVSVKGVIVHDGRVALLRNERAEWELPGGKLEPGEEPHACLAREIREELNLDAAVDSILDCWVYRIAPGVDVLIVTFGCRVRDLTGMAMSREHKALATFALDQVAALTMPEGYKASIRRWSEMLAMKGGPA